MQDVLVPAKLLLNGTTITQEQYDAPFEYFHIELDQHDVILAEGALTETYLDLGNRHMFSGPGVVQILPRNLTRDWSDCCYSPAYSGPVYDDVYRKLQQRAAKLGFQTEQRIAS